MPVSTCRLGSGTSSLGERRLYWINTLFQISVKRPQSPLTAQTCPGSSCFSQASGPRSQWISVQGPQGPVSAISQKLSLRPEVTRWLESKPGWLSQTCAASLSSGICPSSSLKVVAQIRFLSKPHTWVSSSQDQEMASFL